MKAPRGSGNTGVWERTIGRYLTANRIPLAWAGHLTGFVGVSGYTFRRIVPKRAATVQAETWKGMPAYFREHRDDHNLIVIVTNKQYGDDLEDSLVVMRLGTFTPMFATHINSDKERYIHAANDHR